MARAFPLSNGDLGQEPAGEWHALRGELVALLDQVEGQYARGGAADPAFSGFAQRMRDLRQQVGDTPADDRHREALRTVKRQVERFTEREPEPQPNPENVLQSAIQQIRARTQGIASASPRSQMSGPAAVVPMPQPAPAPRFDDLSRSMAGLSGRLEQLESELRSQRSSGGQIREIADQVAQLSHVVELMAGAVGETGQVKRLESQIAGIAQLVGQAPRVDLTQVNERLDSVAATVDRLADLQVQQIEHVVRGAEAAEREGETAQAMRAIEQSVRTVYDRLEALEAKPGVPPAEIDRITDALALISQRLGSDNARPERLLALVDALNGRINELEVRGDQLAGLKGEMETLRASVLGAMEPLRASVLGAVEPLQASVIGAMEPRLQAFQPRFDAIEARLGTLDERLSTPAADAGVAQVEAQVRQLVARMDQTSEQLAELARLYQEAEAQPDAPAPDFDALARMAAARALAAMPPAEAMPQPDFEALANLAAARSVAAMQREAPQAAEPAPLPDFEALANAAAARAIAGLPQPEPDTRPTVSEASLAAFEQRITRLVESMTRTRTPEGANGMREGLGRIEERLHQLEAVLMRRVEQAAPSPAPAPAPVSVPPLTTPAMVSALPISTPETMPADDFMPRNPGEEAPLKEFGFPDMGPVRAALEAKSGRKLPASADKRTADSALATMPITPQMAGGVVRDKAAAEPAATPPAFDPASVERPPRPESSLDAEPSAVALPASSGPEVPSASRSTFIEAARRAAQRQNPAPADSNSLIGRALGRFQPGTAAPKEAAAKPVAKAPVMPEPVPPAPEPKPARAGLFSRGAKPVVAPAAVEPTPAPAIAVEVPQAKGAPKESFLLRHRRAILLGASIIAISFMALNLVMQRMAMNDTPAPGTMAPEASAPAPAASAPAAIAPGASASPAAAAPAATPAATTAPAASSGDAPTAAAPASSTPAATPADGGEGKPVSEITPDTESTHDSADASTDAAGPRIPTDPVTTASITPAMAFAPANGANADTGIPPALAAAAATAAAPANVQLASLPSDTSATAAPAAAPAAPDTTATANPASPAPLESPVKVDLPPDTVGPLDLRQAAADGDARAQFEIAAIYSEGRAVPQDLKQAGVWYERAAAQGFGPAQYRLGNLYENGKGVDKDLEQARLWYQRAAEAGNRMAMHNLAALYAGGQFGKQDFASAAEWFERAANLGMKDSQFNLGMLYARGLGVTQNMETSYKWFALASTGGDPEAAKARDSVARSLDAEAVKRAQAAVAAWKLQTVNLVANFAPLGTWEKNFNPGPVVSNKDVVMKVQVALMRLGYDIGTPDGHMGPKTTVAIKAFEQGTGMTQVGQINPRLLAVLGSQPV